MYDQDLKRKRDNAAAEEYVRQSGKREGIEAGRLEGKLEVKLEMAKRLIKSNKLSLEEIVEITELPIKTIKEL